MPLIGTVGRRSLKVRLLNMGIHAVLIVGAATMVYPFLIMLSGSIKCSVDFVEMNVIPEYLYRDAALFRKFVAARNNESLAQAHMRYGRRFDSFRQIPMPPETAREITEDWRDFLTGTEQARQHDDPGAGIFAISEASASGIIPRSSREFAQMLKERYAHDLEMLNRDLGSSYAAWEDIRLPNERLMDRDAAMNRSDALYPLYCTFKQMLPVWRRAWLNPDGTFMDFLHVRYGGNLAALNAALRTDFAAWDEIRFTERLPDGALGKAWHDFVVHRLPLSLIRVDRAAENAYRGFLQQRYGNDLSGFNRAYETHYADWRQVMLPDAAPTNTGASSADWVAFIAGVAPEYLRISTQAVAYRQFLEKRYEGDIDKLNRTYRRGYERFGAIPLPRLLPADNIRLADDWLCFIREAARPEQLTLQPTAFAEYLGWLADRYPKSNSDPQAPAVDRLDFAALNAAWGTAYNPDGSGGLPTLDCPPESAVRWRGDWHAFVLSPRAGRLVACEPSAQSEWQRFLEKRHGDIGTFNRRCHLVYASFAEVAMPLLADDYRTFREKRDEIKWEFLTRNYRMVINAIIIDGHAAWNTLVYCTLAILAALIVNPLAAYALSRYKPPSAYKLLLFLMLTMAFPPMVLGIPNFLIMKQLGLLNTFGALILPGIANGYSIFLLKGFFDSLPRQLYESASIDGASEWIMFSRITMSLSRPILAIIALHAFTAAYGNFMFAFITCQDPSMWTIMVNLYQLQARSSQSVQFASLVFAAIPTFIVFAVCQKTILKGIVVPTEK